MKYDFSYRMLGTVLASVTKKAAPGKIRAVRREYREILTRAGDIGPGNRLFTSYALAAWFIAMNRNTGLTPEENLAVLEQWMKTSRLFKAAMGSPASYFSEKNMASRRQWSAQTYQRKYPNDWVVDVVEKTPEFEFGFDYRECGVCKLCRDEGCFELAKYLCRLDFLIVAVMGIRLNRTMTLADGGDHCDFRFVRVGKADS